MKEAPGFYVLTYDVNAGDFTEQDGVTPGPYSQFGLRAAIRQLQEASYPCGRQDPSVYVYRVLTEAEEAAEAVTFANAIARGRAMLGET